MRQLVLGQKHFTTDPLEDQLSDIEQQLSDAAFNSKAYWHDKEVQVTLAILKENYTLTVPGDDQLLNANNTAKATISKLKELYC